MRDVRSYPKELIERYRRIWLGITIVDAFERTCDIIPAKEAVVDGNKRLNFAQLRDKVHTAAEVFLKLGLGGGSPVLLQVPNSIEAIYIYLGLTMIGVSPVLCLPRHGQRELERFASLTNATTWIGALNQGKINYINMVKAVQNKNPSLKNLIVVENVGRPDFVSLTDLMEEHTTSSDIETYLKELRPSPDDILHLAPTGGTTGLPKLVPRTHNAHLCKAYYWARAAERSFKDIDLVVAPINHDAPQLCHMSFMALFGGTLAFCPSPKPSVIVDILEKEKITFSFMVPTLLSDLAKEPDVEQHRFSPEFKLAYGGAWASADLIRTICRRFRCRFYSIYGMTEGVGTITRSTDTPDVVERTVGRAMCPYDDYSVVDDDENDLPIGVEGEFVAQGPCIISGYYKSEEDRKAFTRDGFLKTGDIGKFDADSNIIVTGRKKDLIKRGAETIIPFEIEEIISEHPKVSQVAVVGMPDERLGEKICAYIQNLPGEKITFEEINSFLVERGASEMLIPERVEIIDEFPLTTMQKLDKQALRDDIARKIKTEGR
jgi:non-ribosomal peptide synthetase component E (peptide arylation enzyme)